MRSLSLTKKACALLFVFTAFGGVVGTVAPAEAQTPPAQLAFWTRQRSVSFDSSNNVDCYGWRYNTDQRFLVARGSSRTVHDSWYVCRNLTTGWEMVADLFVHGTYGSNGWTLVQYELRTRVNWGGGTVWCSPSVWKIPQGEFTNEAFPFFWYQGRLESGWHTVNCQHQGTIRMAFSVERGLGTW